MSIRNEGVERIRAKLDEIKEMLEEQESLNRKIKSGVPLSDDEVDKFMAVGNDWDTRVRAALAEVERLRDLIDPASN